MCHPQRIGQFQRLLEFALVAFRIRWLDLPPRLNQGVVVHNAVHCFSTHTGDTVSGKKKKRRERVSSVEHKKQNTKSRTHTNSTTPYLSSPRKRTKTLLLAVVASFRMSSRTEGSVLEHTIPGQKGRPFTLTQQTSPGKNVSKSGGGSNNNNEGFKNKSQQQQQCQEQQ